MKTKKLALAIIIACGTLLYSCYNHNWDTLHPNVQTPANATCTVTNTTVISYSATIVPLVAAKCATNGACHSLGGPGSPPGSLGNTDFTFYGSAGSHGSGLDQVCSGGDTVHASVWQYIRGTGGVNKMPLTGSTQLTNCEILELANWINQGAPNN
jgi:hypothetical protein